jgi:hypothetical protein
VEAGIAAETACGKTAGLSGSAVCGTVFCGSAWAGACGFLSSQACIPLSIFFSGAAETLPVVWAAVLPAAFFPPGLFFLSFLFAALISIQAA